MIVLYLAAFVVGGILGAYPWLYENETFSLGIAAWCFVALVGFSGIVTYATQPKVPSDVFKSKF